MATPESKVKSRIKLILEDLGCYFFMPIGGPYSRIGVPDFVGCLNGMFFSIEAKAGKGKTTALQARELQRIKDAGGFAIVVNEENVDLLKATLEKARDGYDYFGL